METKDPESEVSLRERILATFGAHHYKALEFPTGESPGKSCTVFFKQFEVGSSKNLRPLNVQVCFVSQFITDDAGANEKKWVFTQRERPDYPEFRMENPECYGVRKSLTKLVISRIRAVLSEAKVSTAYPAEAVLEEAMREVLTVSESLPSENVDVYCEIPLVVLDDGYSLFIESKLRDVNRIPSIIVNNACTTKKSVLLVRDDALRDFLSKLNKKLEEDYYSNA